MRPVVAFLGPTLSEDEARAVLDAEYMPPAGHGDVLRAALRRPRVIAIVDGVFERTPAVWHKEILFALSEGIHVYGAASMGALRAAELDRFGMRGVGDVYRAYAEGVLEDDDEVAVAHTDAEHGFRALSDSMVDVRATLEKAVGPGGGGATAAGLVARVKATFYAERVLLVALDREDVEHERLRAWLPEGWVRRKREDAIALLRTVERDLAAGLEPFRPTWTLQRTRYWEDARRTVELTGRSRTGTPVRRSPATRISRPCSTRRVSTRTPTARCSSARCSPRSPAMPPRPPGSTRPPGHTRRPSTRSAGVEACWSPRTSRPGWRSEA